MESRLKVLFRYIWTSWNFAYENLSKLARTIEEEQSTNNDIVPSHKTSMLTKLKPKHAINTINQPPDSPDLVTRDFHLFLRLKLCRELEEYFFHWICVVEYINHISCHIFHSVIMKRSIFALLIFNYYFSASRVISSSPHPTPLTDSYHHVDIQSLQPTDQFTGR